MIEVKNDNEIQKMREAGKVTAAVLKQMTEMVKPGISTLDLDQAAELTGRTRNEIISMSLEYALKHMDIEQK